MLWFSPQSGLSDVRRPRSKGLLAPSTHVQRGGPAVIASLILRCVWCLVVASKTPAGLAVATSSRGNDVPELLQSLSDHRVTSGDFSTSSSSLESAVPHSNIGPTRSSAVLAAQASNNFSGSTESEKMQGFRSGEAARRLSGGDGPVKGPLVPKEAPTDGIDALSSPSQSFIPKSPSRRLQSSHASTGNQDCNDVHASKDMCIWAFQVLISDLEDLPTPSPPASVAALRDRGISCPLFVTWEKRNGNNARSLRSNSDEYLLRGCIGKLTPIGIEQLADYALKSAKDDSRFEDITADEVPFLRVKISLLLKFEKARAWDDWEIGKHGVIVKFRDPGGQKREATYLPEVALEHGFDHERSIRNLIKKAGSESPNTIQLNAIEVTRYQSSKIALTYDEYIKSQH